VKVGGGGGAGGGTREVVNVCSSDEEDTYLPSPSPSSDSDLDSLPATGPFFPRSNSNARYRWAEPHLLGPSYQPGLVENSGKARVLFKLLDTFRAIGDRTVVFSRSLGTLAYIQRELAKRGRGERKPWGVLRLDGACPGWKRHDLIRRFNAPDSDIDVFLISTKAGGEGITLTGGNRVIIYDVSFNPCTDGQAARRCYRYGQKKPVSIYRLIAAGSLEQVVFNRQIARESLSARVIDEKPIQRSLRAADLDDLFRAQHRPAPVPASSHNSFRPAPLAPHRQPPQSGPLSGPPMQSEPPRTNGYVGRQLAREEGHPDGFKGVEGINHDCGSSGDVEGRAMTHGGADGRIVGKYSGDHGIKALMTELVCML
jgi:hypothetical protein